MTPNIELSLTPPSGSLHLERKLSTWNAVPEIRGLLEQHGMDGTHGRWVGVGHRKRVLGEKALSQCREGSDGYRVWRTG